MSWTSLACQKVWQTQHSNRFVYFKNTWSGTKFFFVILRSGLIRWRFFSKWLHNWFVFSFFLKNNLINFSIFIGDTNYYFTNFIRFFITTCRIKLIILYEFLSLFWYWTFKEFDFFKHSFWMVFKFLGLWKRIRTGSWTLSMSSSSFQLISSRKWKGYSIIIYYKWHGTWKNLRRNLEGKEVANIFSGSFRVPLEFIPSFISNPFIFLQVPSQFPTIVVPKYLSISPLNTLQFILDFFIVLSSVFLSSIIPTFMFFRISIPTFVQCRLDSYNVHK